MSVAARRFSSYDGGVSRVAGWRVLALTALALGCATPAPEPSTEVGGPRDVPVLGEPRPKLLPAEAAAAPAARAE
jgi:hypothetical protein